MCRGRSIDDREGPAVWGDDLMKKARQGPACPGNTTTVVDDDPVRLGMTD